VFQTVVGRDRFPTQSTTSRFLKKSTVHRAERVEAVNQRLLRRMRNGFEGMDEITLDLDSHVIPVFGSQHRAKKGYNPKKPGRKSYRPYLCFVGETRDCLGGRLRPGDRTDHHVQNFLKEMFGRLPGDATLRVRADGGFFSLDFLKWLLREDVHFTVVVPKLPWVQRQILSVADWRDLDGSVSVGARTLSIPGLEGVRFVVIREAVEPGEGPKKQLTLLGGEDCRYNYQVIATDIPGPEEDVWRFYNQRACCENFIKEGVYSFGLDKSVCRTWAGARVYFELVILAYNLMNWFKEKALGRKEHKEMASSVRWKLFWIPAKLVRTGRRVRLRLTEWWRHKTEFRHAQEALG